MIEAIVALDDLPFFVKRELVRFRRKNDYDSLSWTLYQPCTTPEEERIEAYLHERFPEAKRVIFAISREDVDFLLELQSIPIDTFSRVVTT